MEVCREDQHCEEQIVKTYGAVSIAACTYLESVGEVSRGLSKQYEAFVLEMSTVGAISTSTESSVPIGLSPSKTDTP
jgi:hypothetical protein